MILLPLDPLAQPGPRKKFSRRPTDDGPNGTQDAVHWVTIQQRKMFQ
jgi:hypothetical protein